ncbi:MAG TPA: hypothetical protein VGM52_08795 [Herbaspirillum sp.]|jgi:hypothetical protein
MLSGISAALNSANNAPAMTETAADQSRQTLSASVSASNTASNTGPAPTSSTNVQISAAALQLIKGDAEAPQSVAGQKALAAEARRRLAAIFDYTDDAAIAKADNEVPDTDDPALLARATQATGFIHHTAANPFAALPRDQLVAIVYDDSGAYTTNERLAAMSQQQNMDYNNMTRAFALDQIGGDHIGLDQALIGAYDQLSPMEKALGQYPATYKSDLEAKIEAGAKKEKNPLLHANGVLPFDPSRGMGDIATKPLVSYDGNSAGSANANPDAGTAAVNTQAPSAPPESDGNMSPPIADQLDKSRKKSDIRDFLAGQIDSMHLHNAKPRHSVSQEPLNALINAGVDTSA